MWHSSPSYIDTITKHHTPIFCFLIKIYFIFFQDFFYLCENTILRYFCFTNINWLWVNAGKKFILRKWLFQREASWRAGSGMNKSLSGSSSLYMNFNHFQFVFYLFKNPNLRKQHPFYCLSLSFPLSLKILDRSVFIPTHWHMTGICPIKC